MLHLTPNNARCTFDFYPVGMHVKKWIDSWLEAMWLMFLECESRALFGGSSLSTMPYRIHGTLRCYWFRASAHCEGKLNLFLVWAKKINSLLFLDNSSKTLLFPFHNVPVPHLRKRPFWYLIWGSIGGTFSPGRPLNSRKQRRDISTSWKPKKQRKKNTRMWL